MFGFDADGAATHLRRHRRAGSKIAALPDGMRPQTTREGYLAQSRLGDDDALFG